MTVRISPRALSVGSAYRLLGDPGCGGVVLFAGRVRRESSGRRELTALEYEADRVLAERGLEELERTAVRRFGVRRVVLWHRTGRLPIGAISVIVGVAAPHRAAAFRAAAYLIDALKREVPIWKTDRARSVRRPRPRRRPPAPRSAD